MPISDIGSYVTTGQEFDSHWNDVDADRSANALPAFVLPDGYGLPDFSADLAAVTAAITAQESLDNALTIATNGRDAQKDTLRDRVIDFRKQTDYRLKNSIYSTSLPATPPISSSEQKFLRALDDVADLWTRINADTTTPNFTPPLVFSDGFALAAFEAAVAALRTQYKAVVDAENDARIGRKRRDALLDPFRDRMVEYRQGIEIEYGEQHAFTLSLPDVYPPNGGGGPTLPTFPFRWLQSEPGIVLIWFTMIAGLTDVLTLFAREGTAELSFQVDGVPTGQTVQATWVDVTITGDVDEVTLRDSQGIDIARGVFDPELPNPGP